MKSEERAWLAGLFEGEGSFYVNTIKKNGKKYQYAAAALKMTDLDVIRQFREVLGFGRINKQARAQKHWKDAWMWIVHGREKVEKLYEIIGPWLYSRRTRAYKRVMRAGK